MKNKKLSEKQSWTLSILDTIDFLAWRTKELLGISKTRLIKKVLEISHDKKDVETEYKKVQKILTEERKKSRVKNIYDDKINGLWIDPNEALRRLRFFSEDYLNKEFDIFMNLSSDNYLDFLYSEIFNFKKGGEWISHGNGASFKEFTLNIPKLANEVQMDNLIYNESKKILIANELKLGAKANKDQVFKYAYLFSKLMENNLINKGDKFILTFIGTGKETINKKEKIKQEKEFFTTKPNKKIFNSETIKIVDNMEIKNLTWNNLIEINEEYLDGLDIKKQQVEIKLILGFNQSLKEKHLLQNKKLK